MSAAADRRAAYAFCAQAIATAMRTENVAWVAKVRDALLAASRVEDGPGVAEHISGDGMAPAQAANLAPGRVADVAVPVGAPFDEPTPPRPATGVCHRCVAYCAPGETLCDEHRPRTNHGEHEP
jgi:hypothetical protein